MTGDIREVPMPDSIAAPEHTMSPEGQARLAALTPEQLSDGATLTEIRSAKAVRDADGNEANIETGEYTPAEKPEVDPDGQAQRTQPAPVMDVSAIPELFVSPTLEPDAAMYREDIAAIAADYPALADEAAILYQFCGNLAAAAYDRDAGDGIMSNGQVPGPTLWNESQCRSTLRQQYGSSIADGLMDGAAREFQKLPAKVRDYLMADMGNGAKLANHPAVVTGLALRAYAAMSPERAQAELTRLRSEKTYGQGGKLERDKLMLLNLAATRSTSTPQPQPGARGIVYKTDARGGSDAAYPTQGSQAAAALRKELNALSKGLMDERGELSRDSKKRKAAVARRAEIQAQLTPEAK